MYLQSIKIDQFKNHRDTLMRPLPGINLVLGKNGMGKTNLLDAIYFSLFGRSYFSAREVQNLMHEAAFYRIESRIQTPDDSYKIVIKYNGRSKTIESDDVAYKSIADFIGIFPVTFITPGDIDLVIGGSEVRRKFIDQTLSQMQSGYLNALMHYNKVLKQRNALLKQMSSQGLADSDVLNALDLQLEQYGTPVFKFRERFVSNFQPVFDRIYQTISDNNESILLNYHSDLQSIAFTEGLNNCRRKDFILQRTNFGIHRDNLELTLRGFPLQHEGSQGQIKTAVLALKLAQYVYLREASGKQPILLLDDVFDKLDPFRIEKLLRIITAEDFGQVFISDTFSNRLEEIIQSKLSLEYGKFVIEDGRIISQNTSHDSQK